MSRARRVRRGVQRGTCAVYGAFAGHMDHSEVPAPFTAHSRGTFPRPVGTLWRNVFSLQEIASLKLAREWWKD